MDVEERNMAVRYRTQTVGEVEVFYCEAEPAGTPVSLLLHGFLTAGHMFRNLIGAEGPTAQKHTLAHCTQIMGPRRMLQRSLITKV